MVTSDIFRLNHNALSFNYQQTLDIHLRNYKKFIHTMKIEKKVHQKNMEPTAKMSVTWYAAMVNS